MGVLFFYSGVILAQNWQDKQWLRLLTYRKTLTGFEAEADTSTFFVHPEGKTNPKKELHAFIESLKYDDPDPKKNSFCRFPARLRWLRKHMSVPGSKVECEDYIKFRERINPKSISIVFSSYYLSNPASSFGHTFIRLAKQTNEARDQDSSATELLDTGINYGANTEGAGPVFFAVGGLTGWFQGNYNAVPYYYKVREYNDFETRDLWSYQLNMTQEEIDFILDHIWELGHAKFDYYFLTENCSYHVLSILEAARPSLELHQHLPRLYTIPSETLKAIKAEGLVRKISFRPAPSTQFHHQLKMLNAHERAEVENLVFKKKPVISNLTSERKALVYDTALSLIDYRYAREILRGDEEAQNLKRPLLVARSKIPVRSEELNYDDKLSHAPHKGHGQKRLGLGYVNLGNKNFFEAEFRFAFHDLLDNDIGYPPKTRLEVMKGIMRTDGENHQLHEFSLVDVLTLGRWDIFNMASSWKFKMGHYQTRHENEFLSTQGVQGGYGYSLEYGLLSPFLLAHLETSYISERLRKIKLGYGVDLGALIEFTSSWKLQTLVEYRAHPWEESAFRNEIRYSTPNFGVGFTYKSFFDDGTLEAGLKFFSYF